MKSKSVYSTTSFTPAVISGQIKGLKNILYFQFMVRLHKCSAQERAVGGRDESEGSTHTLHRYPGTTPGQVCSPWLPLPAPGTNCWVAPAWQDLTHRPGAAWVAQAGAQRTKSGKLWFPKQAAKTASSLTARKSNEL